IFLTATTLSGRRTTMCNAYYAAGVSSIMPHISGTVRRAVLAISILSGYIARFILKVCLTASILWHYSLYTLFRERTYAETPQNRPKGDCAQARRGAQPSSGIDLGSAVQGTWFLRPKRFGASALRDVATPARRRAIGSCRCRGLWGFATDFLSSTKRIRQIRSDGPATQTARAEGGTQTIGTSDRLHSRDEKIAARHHHSRMSADHQRAFRHHISSSQSRAGAGAEKKRQGVDSPQSMLQRSTEAYEILRAQALHPEEHQNSDSDRVVLIRQGMAAWIRRTEDHNL